MFSSSKCSQGPVGWSSVNPFDNFSTKVQNFSSQRPNTLEKNSKKVFFFEMFYGHVDCSFKNPDKLSLKRAKKTSLNVRKQQKKLKFLQKIILPPKIPKDKDM